MHDDAIEFKNQLVKELQNAVLQKLPNKPYIECSAGGWYGNVDINQTISNPITVNINFEISDSAAEKIAVAIRESKSTRGLFDRFFN